MDCPLCLQPCLWQSSCSSLPQLPVPAAQAAFTLGFSPSPGPQQWSSASPPSTEPAQIKWKMAVKNTQEERFAHFKALIHPADQQLVFYIYYNKRMHVGSWGDLNEWPKDTQIRGRKLRPKTNNLCSCIKETLFPNELVQKPLLT